VLQQKSLKLGSYASIRNARDGDIPVVKFGRYKHWQGQDAVARSTLAMLVRLKNFRSFFMSNTQAPYARIVCNLSPAGVRDAVRKGNWTGATATYDLQPDSELWERFFELEPALEYESDGYGDEFAAGAVLVIGRPIEIIIENSERNFLQINDFDFVQAWRKPLKEMRLGDAAEAIKFDNYLSEFELLEEETKLRALALTEGEESYQTMIASWRRWVSQYGVKYVIETIDAGEKINAKFVSYLQKNELSNAVDSLKNALDEFNIAVDDDHRAALMDCLSQASVTICAVAVAAAQSESKTKEIEVASYWIAEFGSSRLKKAVELGLLPKSMGAYRDERLNLERPGWSWVERGDVLKDVVNPSEADLDALANARKIDASSQLRFNSGNRSIWVTGQFLNRQIMVRPSSLVGSSKYEFDEEPF